MLFLVDVHAINRQQDQCAEALESSAAAKGLRTGSQATSKRSVSTASVSLSAVGDAGRLVVLMCSSGLRENEPELGGAEASAMGECADWVCSCGLSVVVVVLPRCTQYGTARKRSERAGSAAMSLARLGSSSPLCQQNAMDEC